MAGYKSADLYREAEQTQLATILAAANTAIDEATSFDQVYEVITSSKVFETFGGLGYINYILTFPTREMRDAFKENFDSDIEICKELL